MTTLCFHFSFFRMRFSRKNEAWLSQSIFIQLVQLQLELHCVWPRKSGKCKCKVRPVRPVRRAQSAERGRALVSNLTDSIAVINALREFIGLGALTEIQPAPAPETGYPPVLIRLSREQAAQYRTEVAGVRVPWSVVRRFMPDDFDSVPLAERRRDGSLQQLLRRAAPALLALWLRARS
jgi:hypothetical protein